jgi:hypothetical protein
VTLAVLALVKRASPGRPVLAFWALGFATGPLVIYLAFSAILHNRFEIPVCILTLIAEPAAVILAVISLVQRRRGWGWALAAVAIAIAIYAFVLFFLLTTPFVRED